MNRLHGLRRIVFVLLMTAIAVSSAAAQTKRRPVTPKAGAAKAATTSKARATEPKFKAIFEPVSYTEDLGLTSVFFVGEDEGWASGRAGTIIHTKDGGQTWTAQMGGDPQSPEATIDDLYFLDSKNGWAVGAGENVVQRKLLGTKDGQRWRQVGTMGTPLGAYLDYAFTSPTKGYFLEGSVGTTHAIHQTLDGGRNWKPVLKQCSVKVRIAGLNKDLACRLTDIFFLTPDLGWAAGAGGAGTVVIFKTTNGGNSWAPIFAEPELGHPDEFHFKQLIFFKDEDNGFLLLSRADKLLSTADGGKTWEAVPVPASGEAIRFADPEVGWIYEGNKLTFTVNGGANWTSREIRFPTYVQDFSLPSRERAYVVGDSGMVFRYRVVEATHEDPESIPAPMMPRFSESLEPELAELTQDAEALEEKFEQFTGSSDSAAAAATETEPARSTPPAESGEPAGAGAEESQAEEPAEATFEQAAAAAPSDFIDDCCKAEMKELQSDMGTFLQEVPLVTSKYKSLNLIFAGLRMVTNLMSQSNGMKSAFQNLKQAKDVNSATAALQELLSNIDSSKQALSGGFDSPPPIDDFGGGGGGAAGFAQQVVEESTADASEEPAAPKPVEQKPAKASKSEKVKEVIKKIPW